MLSDKKIKAIEALLISDGKEEASRRAGISIRCLYNYCHDPEFQAEYRKRCLQVVDETTRYLQRNSLNVVIELYKTATAKGKSANKTLAGKTFLDYCQKYTETADLLERIERLEENERNRNKDKKT